MNILTIFLHLTATLCHLNVYPGLEYNDDISYRIIKQSDGLSDNKVSSILRDSLGTCWVGTPKGLNRIYEGHVYDYNHDPALCNTEVTFITKDRHNNIWLSAKGLFLYDYATDSFHEMKIDGKSVRPEWYSESSDAMIFCSPNGITRFSHSTRQHEMLIPRVWKESRYNGFSMNSDTTAIATAIDGIVYRINMTTGKRNEIYRFDEGISVKSSFTDSHGNTWFAIYRKGLFGFSDQGLEKTFLHGESFFKESIILDIMEYNGSLYIATDGEGVFIMNPETSSVCNLRDLYRTKLPDEINSVNCMHRFNGEMLFGTIRHGIIFQGNEKVRIMKDAAFGGYSENGPNRSVVNSVAEDVKGRIWVGTDGGGLHIYNPYTGSLHEIESFRKEKVVGIEAIDDRYILVSIYNKGIFRFDTATGHRAYIPIIDKNTTDIALGQDIIIGLERIAEDKIMILAKSVFIYDHAKGIIHDSEINLPGTHNLRYITSDSTDTYLNTRYEIFRVDNRTLESELLFHDPNGNINCIQMIDGRLYMIWSYSLARLESDPVRPVILPFHYNKKLMPVMEADTDGNIWLATRNDIIFIRNQDPDDYIRYGHEEGVSCNDFLEGISMISRSGKVFFGGNSGLCIIDADEPGKCIEKKKVHLVRICVNNENIAGTDNEKGDRTNITIPWNYESMHIDISTEGDRVFMENKFRYTINEYGKQNVIYSDSHLSLPALAAGKYTIRIAYADMTDTWVNSGKIISVTVAPPWWKNLALIWSLTFIVAAIIFTFIYFYHRNEKVKAALTYRRRKEKLTENKLKFLTDISHELKTPLTLIYNPLKRILENGGFEDGTQKELSNILSQSKYMNQLISMVLDSRKLEEGFGTLNITTHNIKSWIESICEEFRTEFSNKSMILSCDIPASAGSLNFDESKFRIILSNFLMNAWKYSEPETTVSVTVRRTEGRTRISVTDEGIGISPEDSDKLFNRFTQGGRAAKGFGLGLSYTKLLVETHPGGQIGAYANPAKGSTFWFEIPDDLQCQRETSIPSKTGNYQPCLPSETVQINTDLDFDTSIYSVLIAEDETDLRHFLKKELKDHFKNIITVSDGMEALRMTRTAMPDIIISDVMMPGMNGYELCKEIKSDIRISHIPVILITAIEGNEGRESGYKSGADIYLTKPFETSVLIAAICNLLHIRNCMKDKYKIISEKVTAVESTFSNADEEFLTNLDRFIESNLKNDSLNAQMIIENSCMGRATFYKKIKDLTGLGIMEYVTRKRMTKAAELLSKTQLPISEIGQRAGYPDNQYFSKVFRQHFNMSPRTYRNQSSLPDGI